MCGPCSDTLFHFDAQFYFFFFKVSTISNKDLNPVALTLSTLIV